jgi:hypothetical protein
VSVFKRLFATCVLACGIMGSAVSNAQEDVILSYLTEGEAGVLESVRFQIKGNLLRFSFLSGMPGAGNNDYYLYNNNSGQIRYVQPDSRSYYEIGANMMSEAMSQLDTQRARLQGLLDTNLADAPAAQQDAVRGALESLDLAIAQAEAYFDQAGSTVPTLGPEIGLLVLDGIECTLHAVVLYQTQMEVCFATPADLQLEATELEVLQGFQQRLTDSTGVVNLYNLLPGKLPLVAVYGSMDVPAGVSTRFSGAERTILPNSIFVLSADYMSRIPGSAP